MSSLCTLLAPRQIHDAGRPSHVLPMAIHRSVHKAKGAGCGRLPGTVVASRSGGSSASLRKMRPDFIPPRRCPWTPLPAHVFASARPVTCVCIHGVFGRVRSRVGGARVCVRVCGGTLLSLKCTDYRLTDYLWSLYVSKGIYSPNEKWGETIRGAERTIVEYKAHFCN